MLGKDLSKYRCKSRAPTIRGDSVIAFPDDYVCVDLETTGLHYNRDSIIEVCVYSVNDRKVTDKIVTLVKPPKAIPSFITRLTGISNPMVSKSPGISDILPDVRGMIGDRMILGHFVSFDIKFLNFNFASNGIDKAMNDFIDTLRISKKMVRGLPNYKLSTISEYFHVNAPAHRAEADVQSAIGCFEAMRRIWEKQTED